MVGDDLIICTGTGVETFTCGSCGHQYTERIPALGHTEESIPAKAPTCTETGLTEGVKCTVCGRTLTAQEEVAATGHTNSKAVVENQVAATCTAPGSYDEVVYCLACGDEVSRTAKTINIHSISADKMFNNSGKLCGA